MNDKSSSVEDKATWNVAKWQALKFYKYQEWIDDQVDKESYPRWIKSLKHLMSRLNYMLDWDVKDRMKKAQALHRKFINLSGYDDEVFQEQADMTAEDLQDELMSIEAEMMKKLDKKGFLQPPSGSDKWREADEEADELVNNNKGIF